MNQLQLRLLTIKQSLLSQTNDYQYNRMPDYWRKDLIEKLLCIDCEVYKNNRTIDHILNKAATDYYKANNISGLNTFEILLEIFDLAEKYASNWIFN
jgi:hypothetical protein